MNISIKDIFQLSLKKFKCNTAKTEDQEVENHFLLIKQPIKNRKLLQIDFEFNGKKIASNNICDGLSALAKIV